ncbi:hypothetical protein [Pseudonocardia oceani]|uniref:Lipoprotein n=3 Tax=Pseudonocardia oceani TaxID=2792013 RepID=A0ABS6UGA5_9PSEU|nr:hypothetical protein [Pseudonocardia oceani]MBW0093544.1 hypothetical protein [Pseudonocardia oceani]MBW0131270.1 hypothetical protein [Pseudonocardia oceani]
MRRAVGLALAAVGLAACTGPGADRPDAAGPGAGVTVSEVTQERAFYEGELLGRSVTVVGAVAEVLGPATLAVSDGSVGGRTLTVLSRAPVTVEEGRAVRVTGRVGQLHRVTPSDGVPYSQTGLYARADTEAYLYDAVVEPLAR